MLTSRSQDAVSLPRPTRTKKAADEAVRSSALTVLNITLTHYRGLRASANLHLAPNPFEERERQRPKLRNNPNHHKLLTLLAVKLCAEPGGHRMSLRTHLLPG